MAPAPDPSPVDSTDDRLALGKRGEDAAASFLEARGHRLLARRFRTRHGEIDLISQRGKHLYFTEVKCRRANRGRLDFGNGFEAVGPRKQRRIATLSQIFIDRKRLHALVPHFSVIAIEQQGDSAQLHFLPDAFHVS